MFQVVAHDIDFFMDMWQQADGVFSGLKDDKLLAGRDFLQ